MFTLNCDRAYLFAHPERELTADEQSRYDAALAERARGVPAQYITGHQEFWGMDLIVTPAVLIPRPETEHVIEAVLELHKVRRRTSGRRPQTRGPRSEVRRSTLRIADVGTGSGAIALALAKEFPHAEIHATDISPRRARNRPRQRRPPSTRTLASSSIKPTCSQDSTLRTSISSSPTRPTSANPKKIKSNSKSANSNRATPSSPGHRTRSDRAPDPASQAALKPGGWLIMEISGTIADEVRELLKAGTKSKSTGPAINPARSRKRENIARISRIITDKPETV